MYANEEDALPLKQRSSRRRFIAMDIENINGGALTGNESAAVAWREVADVIGLSDHEHVVVGVGPSSLLAAGLGCRSARFVLGRGLNGADHALIEVLRSERIPNRFDEVVIVSGDGEFSEVAAWLASEGAGVTVVARDGHLSRRLQMAATNIVLLPNRAEILGQAA